MMQKEVQTSSTLTSLHHSKEKRNFIGYLSMKPPRDEHRTSTNGKFGTASDSRAKGSSHILIALKGKKQSKWSTMCVRATNEELTLVQRQMRQGAPLCSMCRREWVGTR